MVITNEETAYLWTWTRVASVIIIDGHAWPHAEPLFYIFVLVGPWLASLEYFTIETLLQQLATDWQSCMAQLFLGAIVGSRIN
jgi:hypothetical protein